MSMFSSVLIANRGEIAVRIARTATRLGLRTIAVYSEADAGAFHTRVCDEAVLIGPASPRESYLAVDKLVEAARRADAQCVHPGYGFLSEHAEFAEACAKAGVVFVGPPPAAIRAMGLKDRAKALMERAGVPVVPGYHGGQQSAAFLKRKAYEIGYPVLIKAVAGGGGRGMRRIDKHAEFEEGLASAQREAMAAFGDARVLVEKCIEAPRHIEIQVFADHKGNAIHLHERDCSLQRRHQKVIEEAPASGMTAALRAEMGAAAVAAARAVGYVGAGTVEFIADDSAGLRSGGFWFLEMNTHLQVEHPVTEAITGLDLVEWQLRVAAGEALPLAQGEVPLAGHAVEARIYAEDPVRGFLPSSGRIAALELPVGEGIRVDAGVAPGDTVPPDYDPMIAKIIAHAPTRNEALDRLAVALRDTIVAGPRVNTPFLKALAEHPEFRAGRFDTGFIDRHLAELLYADPGDEAQAVAHAVAILLDRERRRIADAEMVPKSLSHLAWRDPWSANDGFALGPARVIALDILVDGAARQARVAWGPGGAQVTVDGVPPPYPPPQAGEGREGAARSRVIEVADGAIVVSGGRQYHVALMRHDAPDGRHIGDDGVLRAPMNGKVVAVFVEPGQAVKKGARIALMEA
ncbi:MAG TPA: biotin carboxylase N-terminal domain-containing protein, partial [Xanthobacteraceae bacterium]|nr:biotin carboxylase N-terminal domain-containing protein [Xanthobacteraceae bacterium]